MTPEQDRDPEGLEIERLSDKISDCLAGERIDDCIAALALNLAAGLRLAYEGEPAKLWRSWENTSRFIRRRLREGP